MDNKQIIIEFLTKMATQDNRSTAYPIFYTIRSSTYEPTAEGCGDKTVWLWDDEEYDSEEELKAAMVEHGIDEDDAMYKTMMREDIQTYDVKKVWKEKGMFLTETDAESHLKLNYYHYSEDAHTYVNHAWRAPELEEFINALYKEFNINEPS